MSNGIWDKDTYMNAKPDTQAAMTMDMLKSIDNRLIKVCEQPTLCNDLMDNKIKAERKRRGRINIGLGSGGGIGAFGILEIFRRWFNG